jgi:predicted Zn-dependent protease
MWSFLALALTSLPASSARSETPPEAPVVVIRTLPQRPKAKPAAPRVVRSRTAGSRSVYRAPKVTRAVRTPAPRRTATVRRRPVRTASAERQTRRRTEPTPSKAVRTVRAPAVPKRSTRAAEATGAVALNARGYALLRQGRFAEAEPLLRRAVRQKPDYAYALYNLGWSLVAQGKAREAIEPLRESAALQPSRWQPQQRLAEAYEQIGNGAMAFEARARARELRGSRRSAAPSPTEPQVAVRMEIGEAAWMGSTDRREAAYLKARQEYRAQQDLPPPSDDTEPR